MRIKDFFITGISYLKRRDKAALIKQSYAFRSKKGLEIGGPSAFFSLKGYFPVYLFAKQIDGVNYSNDTIWEGTIIEGNNYKYYDKTGYQYIKEAVDLSGIGDNSFDFILSCHSLEHVANPLKALKEWSRVLKKGGSIVLVLPDKNFFFDIYRPYTSMQHLVADFENNVTEADTTHFKEIIDGLGPHNIAEGRSKEDTIKMIEDNYRTRCIHHHVFNQQLIKEMLEWAGFEVKHQSEPAKVNLFAIAQKEATKVSGNAL